VRALVLCLVLASCGSSAEPFDAGAGDGAPAAVDGCAGCWSGGTCILRADQTDNFCGAPGAACAPTLLECSGAVGTCAQGEQLAARHLCGEPAGQSITRPVCCPVNVCTYDACR
jgi:hypothetical protein